jgi:iron complex outermembrane receptor protein
MERKNSVRVAVAVFGAGWIPVLAQTVGPRSVDDHSKAEVIITGSMLPQAQAQPSPAASSFSAEQIRESGATTAAEFIRSLPADNSGSLSTAFVGGFAIGGSAVSLRGLTVNSTLVLIDGRRAAPYALSDDGQRSFVDLNTLPLDCVERIEVLRDGASSLYGADAIAGVVNIILRKQYQGAEINVEAGRGQHAGGSTRRVSGSVGIGDLDVDRYNGYLDFEYQGDDRILAVDRSFPFNTKDLSSNGGFDSRNGTPGSFTGTTAAIVAPAVLPAGAAAPDILNTVQAGPYRPLTTCSGIGNSSATAPSAIAGATDSFCLQNKASYNDVQPPERRIGVSGRFTLKLNEAAQIYLNESYYQNDAQGDYRPIQLQDIVPVNTENIALPPRLSNGQLNPNDPFAAAGSWQSLSGQLLQPVQPQRSVLSAVFRGLAEFGQPEPQAREVGQLHFTGHMESSRRHLGRGGSIRDQKKGRDRASEYHSGIGSLSEWSAHSRRPCGGS